MFRRGFIGSLLSLLGLGSVELSSLPVMAEATSIRKTHPAPRFVEVVGDKPGYELILININTISAVSVSANIIYVAFAFGRLNCDSTRLPMVGNEHFIEVLRQESSLRHQLAT